MATPVVTGAAALLLQQYPSLTPDQVKARLMKTAQKSVTLFPSARDRVTGAVFNMQSDVFTVGAGYLDIQAALYNTDLASLPAVSPTAVYNTTTHKVTIARNSLTSWGSSVVWGDTLLYGVFVLNGLSDDDFSVVWGDSAIWGMDDGGDGFSVVWGDCIFLVANLSALGDGDDDEFSVIWGD
jgi:serine protease AprX